MVRSGAPAGWMHCAAWGGQCALAVKDPRTLHHRGRGAFMVAGETIRLRSKMK